MLQRQLERPAHAYLFVGPANVGKATVARRFAAALIDGDANRLRRAVAGIHPDVVVVEPDGRSALTVERAREAMTHEALVPVEGARKVFLVEEASLMNDEAANAFLKTLEEPAPSTVFVLCVEAEDDLPATVVSRCRVVRFGRVAPAELKDGLIAAGALAPGRAAEVAAAASGRPGLALDLASRPAAADFRTWWLGVPARLEEHPGTAFHLADEAVAVTEPLLEGLRSRQRAEIEEAAGGVTASFRDRHERHLRRATQALHISGLEILAGFYRDVAAAQFGGPVRNRDVLPALLTAIGPEAALHRAHRVLQTVGSIREHQRPQLAFAALFDDLVTRV